MNNAILHISDLHFVTNSEISSTRFDERFCDQFINTTLHQGIKYLVVTGDISNKAREKEYEKALAFLNKVVDKLKLDKKNVMLCLGNHDISWRELDDIIYNEDISEEDKKEIHKREEKYRYFKEFYNKFYNNSKEFCGKTAIFDKIIDTQDRIIILGVNTCYKESHHKEDHIGFIEKLSFEYELSNIEFNNKYKDYGKILVMHHNPKDLAEERSHNINNWKDLNKNSIGYPYVVLCGHIHGQDGESVETEEGAKIYYISTSSLMQKKSSTNSFNIYNCIESEEINIKYFALQDKENNEKYYWQELTNKKCIKTIQFRKKSNIQIEKPDVFDITDCDNDISKGQKLSEHISNLNDLKKTKNQDNSTNKLIELIKERNLFKSGHFHWKNGFRSHGFIDTNNLVSHKDSLEVITEQFYRQISSKYDDNFTDTIMIAVGIECNVIGARLSALFDCDYSFIPEPTEDKHFTDIESKIESGKHKKIILLKDIIFTAEHSKALLEKDGIKNKEVCIVSLFYCGDKKEKDNIFSEYPNVSYISICDDITINQCNYSREDSLNKCPIYTHKLETIYDEC